MARRTLGNVAAAPHSRGSKYSFTARLDLAGSRSLRQSSPAIERCLLASAWIRLASTAKLSHQTGREACFDDPLEDATEKHPLLRKRSLRARSLKTPFANVCFAQTRMPMAG